MAMLVSGNADYVVSLSALDVLERGENIVAPDNVFIVLAAERPEGRLMRAKSATSNTLPHFFYLDHEEILRDQG